MNRSIAIICIILSTLLFASHSRAQEFVRIEEGPVLELKEKRVLIEFFNYANHAIGSIMKKENKWTGSPDYYMNIYNKQLNLIGEKKLDLKRYGKRLQYEAMVNIGDSLYLISSYDNQKKKKKYLFAESMDRKNFRFHNDRRMIAAFPLTNEKRNRNEKIIYKQSPDHQKIAFYLSHNVRFKENYQLDFAVFDKDLLPIWQSKLSLREKKTEKKLSRISNSEVNYNPKSHPYQLILDNNAQVYVNRKRNEKNIENEPGFYFANQETPRGKEMRFPSDTSVFVPQYDILSDSNNKLYAAAYKYKRHNSNANGLFFTEWNKTTLSKQKHLEFPTKELRLVPEYDYSIKQILAHPNGNISSIGEFSKEKLQRSGTTRNEQLYYNFNDILISQYNSKNNEIKYHRISKEQKGAFRSLPYLSYGIISFEEKFGLIYYPENPLQSPIKVLEYLQVDQDGEIQNQRLRIPNQEEIENPLHVNEIWQFDSTRAVLYQLHKKKIKLYMIHLLDK